MNSTDAASNPRNGLFVVFEGPDGSGKTTISTAICDWLVSNGVGPWRASFPGRERGTLGELVYRLHHDSYSLGVPHITPASVQALHIAAHLDAIESKLRPHVVGGKCLLLDRYWWSTWVYGVASGVPEDVLNPLIEAEVAMWRGAQPDSIFLIRRSAPVDRKMSQPQFDTLADLYHQLAARERVRQRVILIDNDGDMQATLEAVLAELRHLEAMPRKVYE